MVPAAPLVARFAGNLDRLSQPGERLGLAVSGGPDSLALLLLASVTRPGLIEAATVDHDLRAESRAEAELVAGICSGLGVPHRILAVAWREKPVSAIQEQARDGRYELIAGWLRERGLAAVCTGHHRDDQAETLLMRLARGSGVRGLAAMRPSVPLPATPDLKLLRPLLDWSRDDLAAVCVAAGLTPVADPSNDDENFERVRVRKMLASQDWLAGEALARSAQALGSADEAIDWAIGREWSDTVETAGGAVIYRPDSAPAEIRRRIIARIISSLATEGTDTLRGREVDQMLANLQSGGTSTLRGVVARGGSAWRFEPAPPRSSSCG